MDYKFKTTFWDDFSIAEVFGLEEIDDTYMRAFKGWKHDYIYMTELTLVLNWKIWQWYEIDEPRAKLYDKLWRDCDEWCCSHLKGDELSYFYRTLD